MSLLIDNPGLYLSEICLAIKDATGVIVSGSTGCYREMAIQGRKSRKLLNSDVLNTGVPLWLRSLTIQVTFLCGWMKQSVITFESLVIGLPPICHRYLVRGTRLSTISALSSEGLIAHEIMTGTTNGDKFYDFLRCMQSFPAPRSILPLYNCV